MYAQAFESQGTNHGVLESPRTSYARFDPVIARCRRLGQQPGAFEGFYFVQFDPQLVLQCGEPRRATALEVREDGKSCSQSS
jgi:hypothetical protein